MATVEVLTVVLMLHIACSELTNTLSVCSTPGFRIFYSPDVRQDLVDRLPPHSPERLAFAAKLGESHIVKMTRSSQLGIAQEGANINLDCLPWLSRFPGGSIRWKFIPLGDLGNPSVSPQEIPPNEGAFPAERIIVGGDSNRWLNISQTVIIQGAEDSDSKIFMCEVCVDRSSPDIVCHTANYTSWTIGAPPIIINGSSTTYIDAVRNKFSTLLECNVDDPSLPNPIPPPMRSWFKDGQLVSSIQYGEIEDITASYLVTANPILMQSVFDVISPFAILHGAVILTNQINNISNPMLGNLPNGTTLEEARGLLFDIFLGNWTCLVNNSLGSSSVEYILRENGTNVISALENETTKIEIGWLNGSVVTQELSEPIVLPVGVIKGAEFLQENITFSVESSLSSNDSTAFALLTTTVVLSPLFSSGSVFIELCNNGVANRGNTTVHLRLIPMSTFNESGIILHDVLTLTIIDTSRVTLSFSQSEYTVSESNSTFLVQLNKNKPLANPLEVVLTALTLEEANALGCLSLNTSLKQADVNEDFTSTSYFSSRVSFAADEGEPLINQLNISFPLIINDVIAEDRESFVVMIELQPLYETGALVDLQQQSSLVHIIDNDGCESNATVLPLNKNIRWPPTLKGDSADVRCPTNSANITVTRMCDKDRQWLRPVHLQDCYNATIDEAFSEILKMLNQSTFEAEAAALLAERLSSVTRFAIVFGAGQTRKNLEVVTRVFDTLTQSDVNEQVVLGAVSVLNPLSDWQRDVLQERSSNIIKSFEVITANLTVQINFTNLTSITENIIFHTEKRDVEQLLENGKSVKFNTKQGVSFSTTSGNDISRVSLPPSLFKSPRNQTFLLDQPGLIFTSYSTAVLFPLTQYETTNSTRFSMISSSVLGATVVAGQPTAVRDLTEPIVMEFRVNRSMLQNTVSVQCVSWDFEAAGGRGNWTSEGCQAIYSENDNSVQCHCNHLTNFAILVEICVRTGGCEETDSVYFLILKHSSIIGVCLSIGGLLLAILTQLILLITKSRSSKEREKQSAVQYKFYLQLSIALLCMYIVFLAGIDRTKHYIGCVIASVLLHYFALASVLWMSAICSFLFWIMVVNPFAKAKFNCCRMAIITVICWCIPVVPVVIPVAIDRDFAIAYSHEQPREIQFCFIKDQIVFFAAFVGPLFLFILMNAVMFVCITFVQLRHICCTQRQQVKDHNGSKSTSNMGENFVVVLKLWCILCLFGLTWLFGALTITRTASFIFSTLFAVFTSLQGFFIFVFLCLLSKDSLRMYKHICCRCRKLSLTSDSGQKSNHHSTKSSSLATRDLYQSYKPAQDNAMKLAQDNAMKLAFTQELSTKVKRYDHEHDTGDEFKTSTFKPIIIRPCL